MITNGLIEVLNGLTETIGKYDYDFASLTRVDFERLDAILKELIYIVGDDETHTLAPLMDFIGILTTTYANEHIPKLTDIFPELKEDNNSYLTTNEIQSENPNITLENPTNSLAANAFFSIGNLLDEGGKTEEAITAYDQAIHLNPEFYICLLSPR